jgi:hypothetical protein
LLKGRVWLTNLDHGEHHKVKQYNRVPSLRSRPERRSLRSRPERRRECGKEKIRKKEKEIEKNSLLTPTIFDEQLH